MKKLASGLIVAAAICGVILHSTPYLFSTAESGGDSLSAGHKAFASKDFHQALRQYRKAVTEDSENPVAQAWLGYMARAFGHAEEALRAYEKSADLAPSVGSYYSLGEFAGYIGKRNGS